MNVGLKDLRFEFHQDGGKFCYTVAFSFEKTNRYYQLTSSAPSPTQCFDGAMAFLSEMMREAVWCVR